MRYLFGFMCVCALGVVLGCSGTTGDGGTAGSGGEGGTAGGGGAAGGDGGAGAGGTGAILSIGGTVTGLTGGTLVLQNNGEDDLSISSDGAFTFATGLRDGSNYLVTVFSQPSSPKQFCSVTNGSGALAGADITDVAVTCDSGPMVTGFARFRDEDRSGTAGPADVLIVPFDLNVVVNNAGATDFNLPVSDDSLGSGATVSAGPAANEVTITLSAGARLRTRGTFDPANVATGDPSGIDVSATLGADAIEWIGGADAIPSIPINLIPEFIDTDQSLNPNDTTKEIALGDVDGDDDLDLVVVNNINRNRVYTNNGDGSYADSGQALGGTGDSTQAVALGDVDGDEDLDMVTGNNLVPNLVFLNDGDGVFVDSGQALGVDSDFTNAVALGDLDKDGDLDLVVGNGGLSAPNRVFINDGEGVFTDSGQALGDSDRTTTVALGDLDDDGDLDLIEGNGGVGGERPDRVYFNDGTGTFTDSGQSLGVSTTLDVALGDIDDDGDVDLVTGKQGVNSRVYFSDGAGTFTESSQSIPASSTSIDLRDVDDDGDLDLVFGSQVRTTVWINDGAGSFADSGSEILSQNSHSIALGDVDRDGDLDLVISNAFSGSTPPGTRIYTGSLTDR